MRTGVDRIESMDKAIRGTGGFRIEYQHLNWFTPR